MNNTSLVLLQNNQLVTTSEIIAQSIKVQHKNTLDLIKRYSNEIKVLGPLAFETRVGNRPQGGGEKTTFALLNEQQATFLISLSRNTPKVVEFKLALTKAFFEAREALNKSKVENKVEHQSYLKIFKDFCLQHNYSSEEIKMFDYLREQALKQGYAIACAKLKEQESVRQLKDDEVAVKKDTIKKIYLYFNWHSIHKKDMKRAAEMMREQASVLYMAADGYALYKDIIKQDLFDKL